MRRPNAVGTPIDLNRQQSWLREFSAYRQTVDAASVNLWLDQFATNHRDLAARVLDVVDFVGPARIAAFFRQSLAALQGWHEVETRRAGEWRFCAWSGSAGESGDSMMHTFRMANNLDAARYNKLFIFPSQIVAQRLGPDDNLVFVNDFVGTGTEVCKTWANGFSELSAGIGNVYLIVAMACRDGRAKVSNETLVRVLSGHELDAGDNIYHQQCSHFSDSDKATLLEYSKKADSKNVMGFGAQGLVVVFQHRCPNNSVPILHKRSRGWSALFPRHY